MDVSDKRKSLAEFTETAQEKGQMRTVAMFNKNVNCYDAKITRNSGIE
jgi:hypothetical protein